ncbi:MAG TPA: DUF2723 domain-containing protein [Pseudomonadales bacterium]|nr:DUF2723 domain-containing protein [Pseudomonadales bacterium]
MTHAGAAAARSPRRFGDGALFLLGALPPLLLFVVSAPRTITLDDAGLFGMLCSAGAVVHPPGYPAYALLCGAAAQAPLPSVFQSLVLLSSVLAAATCGVVALLGRTLGASAVGGLVAAWVLAGARGFWEQATIPEVYAYNALVTATLVLLILRTDAAAPARRIALVGLITGLGLAGHWPLLLASGPALLLFVLDRRALLGSVLGDWRRLVAGSCGLLLGLLPYAWMAWRLLHPPALTFTDVAGFDDLLAYVRRDYYAAVDTVAGATPADRLAFLAWLPRLVVAQFGPWLLLAPIGAWVLRRRPAVLGALLLLVACHTVVLMVMLSWPFEDRRQSLFEAYPLIAWMTLALLIGVGASVLLARLGALAGHGSIGHRAAAGVALLLAVAVPLGRDGGAGFRAGDAHVDAVGRDLLAGLPPAAMLMVDSDPMTTVLGYLHFVEGVRPDLRLRHYQVLVFPERLYAWGPPAERGAAVTAQLAREDIFFTGRLEHDGVVSGFGLLRRASRAPPASPCEFPEPHVRAALMLASAPPRDAAGREFRDLLAADAARCLLEIAGRTPAALELLKVLQRVPVVARLSINRLLASAPSPSRNAELQRLAAGLRAHPEVDAPRRVAGHTLVLTALAAMVDAPGAPADLALARSELARAERALGADDADVRRALARLAELERASRAGAGAAGDDDGRGR